MKRKKSLVKFLKVQGTNTHQFLSPSDQFWDEEESRPWPPRSKEDLELLGTLKPQGGTGQKLQIDPVLQGGDVADKASPLSAHEDFILEVERNRKRARCCWQPK